MANEPSEGGKLEKLLKMAGFTYKHYEGCCGQWFKPNGDHVGPTIPDLLHSLDAQEKWLVPVLSELGYEVTIVIYRTGLIVTIRSLKLQADVVTNYYHNTNIAHAFAEACLKLIEKGK